MSTYYISFSIQKKKITIIYPKSAALGIFERTRERVQKSHGKQAISVQAREGLLYHINVAIRQVVLFPKVTQICKICCSKLVIRQVFPFQNNP